MGRTLGPFTDVSTARVDGAYEIYEGSDEEGREVEILTLGSTSSKDPSRRALLSDTVAWAHATRGPADAPILSADLAGEQPYVVTLRQTGFRGVERMMERMLAMGPPSGPLPAVTGSMTGQIPAVGYHTNPQGIPRVTSAPPSGSPVAPASPMTSYVTRTQRSRPAWLVPVVLVLSLLIVSAGGFLIFVGVPSESGNAAAEPDKESPADSSSSEADQSGEPEPETPEWVEGDGNDSTVAGFENFSRTEGEEVAMAGWPFAFKVPDYLECEAVGDARIACATDEDGDDEPDSDGVTLDVYVMECAEGCEMQQRDMLSEAWWEAEGMVNVDKVNHATSVGMRDDESGMRYRSMSHFFLPTHNADLHGEAAQVTARASGLLDHDVDLQKMLNDIHMQTPMEP